MKHHFKLNSVLFSLILLFLLQTNFTNAITNFEVKLNRSFVYNSAAENFSNDKNRPNPILQLFKNNKTKNKKITAAIFALPLPFGIVGLHRIYLGCAPYIPIVYIASLGGAFGILPLIDFIVLLNEADITKFNNSNNVFMWVE